ncbi:hypothetical protein SPRG_04894 [Saprolegnia parasitica CBS 223.65]|uniref:RNI-like protein n=1 Tax=Saprolegnia parasitica (strain CBS 223.65) TaxID=695850 RepID=A0A067CH19_SAPPC|nr:hypothetical protein SPRG_04894 [Saprolegnia parasitica CBS 223.65]KDO29778.1 hypothetical protein SPRG_04894 [Saprolegnia parasitica CBS 223.65]|eukprot:XP_012199424.1 hypothetical protein SPRG_04894 [Saprolegnia parasitica CBS 223.65]
MSDNVDARQAKKHKATLLPPEVLQVVATYLQDGKTMHAFVLALPPAWRTEPMAALATLYEAVCSGQLTNTNMASLWHTLDLRYLTFMPKELIPIFQAYAPMLPRLQANLKVHRHLRLPRDTPVTRTRIWSAKELAIALNDWAQQLQSLGLQQDPKKLPIQLVCEVLPRLLKLRRLDVRWHPDARAEETMSLLNRLIASNVTELSLHYDVNSAAQWTAREVTALTHWFQAKPVTSIRLVGVPIKVANAETLARALLQSQTLKSLSVDGGQLPRTLFSLRLSLPTQLESLHTYVRRSEDVPGLTDTIAGSNLRTLTVGTLVPLEKDVVLATNFLDAIISLPRLRHLSITHTAMPLPSVVRLSERLPALTSLQLQNTRLDDFGIAVLARALPNCRHLEALKLDDQECTHWAAEYLASKIPDCPSLKNLDMNFNPIGSRGLRAFLPVVRYLDTLSLSGCGIDDDGADALCRVIDSTDHLYKLSLRANRFSTDAMKRIIRAVSTSSTRWGTVYLCDVIEDEEELDRCRRCAKRYLRNESWCIVE